jgi:hypothetical protein
MGKFSVATYNELLAIEPADECFNQQLASAGITRAQFLSQLAPLFLEKENAGRYAACLIHHHFCLENSERMVANSNSTMPTKNTSANILAERWSCTGEEIEHRFTDDPNSLPPPPSADFFARFKSITDANGIDNLGVCFTPPLEEVAAGFIFFETPGPRDREQVISIVHRSYLEGVKGAYETGWVPTVNPDDQCDLTMKCCHGCSSSGGCTGVNPPPPECKTPPPPKEGDAGVTSRIVEISI